MLNKLHDLGFMTHMPFLVPWKGGKRVLIFCSSDKSRIWKLHCEQNGEVFRIDTGLPPDTIECSPTAWHDAAGWHVSFIGGFTPSNRKYYLYRLDGPCLHSLAAAKAILHANTGFIFQDRIVHGRQNIIYVRKDKAEYEFCFPDSHFYRISYRPDFPDCLLVSIHAEKSNEIYVIELNILTGEQHKIECDGKPAYKCAMLGNEIIYADKCGSGFEERNIKVAKSVKRHFLKQLLPRILENKAQSESVGKIRFEICKECPQAREEGFGCVHHVGCCFGRWRSQPESRCYLGKW